MNNGPPAQSEHGDEQRAQRSSWSGLLYWATGLMVMMLPFAATLLSEGTSFSAYLQSAWGRQLAGNGACARGSRRLVATNACSAAFVDGAAGPKCTVWV